jgi:hypothetical protein
MYIAASFPSPFAFFPSCRSTTRSWELGPLMVVRAGGLLANKRLMDSVVFDLCRGPGLAR